MKKKIVSFALLIGALTLVIISCKKDPDTSVDPQLIRFTVPDGWPAPTYKFDLNPLTKDGFELGRKIFYDKMLSRDFSTSCGSCHQSFAAFAQLDHALSHGVDEQVGNRNSPGLTNLAWASSFFWDGGVTNIELQPLNPIQNPVEMDMRLDTLIKRMNADADYQARFTKVFGSPQVTSQGIFRSLTQFMIMMVSSDSKFDRNANGIPGNEFTASELAGKTIYEQKCAACHKAPLFTDFSFRNNGLPVNVALHDSGRGRITLNASDVGKFKVPSLRNLAYTYPYMHDGRFRTLDQVLDHYDHGVATTATLDPLLQTGIPLNTQQRTDLLAFLNTLNDGTVVKDTKFQEPK